MFGKNKQKKQEQPKFIPVSSLMKFFAHPTIIKGAPRQGDILEAFIEKNNQYITLGKPVNQVLTEMNVFRHNIREEKKSLKERNSEIDKTIDFMKKEKSKNENRREEIKAILDHDLRDDIYVRNGINTDDENKNNSCKENNEFIDIKF